jgi:hypothetical protein
MLARVIVLAIAAATSIRLARAADDATTLAAAPPTAAPAVPPTAEPATPATPETGLRPRSEVNPPHGRIVGGHVFMPAALVPGALITTSFSSSLVLGYGTTSTTIQIGDRVFQGDYDYAGVGANLAYEHSFGRFFSARVQILEAIFSGITGGSVITVGTTLGTQITAGATASMPIGDNLRVGLLFDAGVGPGFGITIGNALKSLADNCRAGDCNVGSTDSIFAQNNTTFFQPALAANWSFWKPLGVTANIGYQHISQDRDNGTFDGDALQLGTALDLDFYNLSGFPMGLQFQASWYAPSGGATLQHITDLGAGLFYTGREHLAAGIQLDWRRFAVNPDLPVNWKTVLSTIGLRYYW